MKTFLRNKIKGLTLAGVCLIVSFVISKYYFQLMLIQGTSMEPAYHDLQMVWLDKRNDFYTYGDVIAFRCDSFDKILVKRVAALPGDSIHIVDGSLYVNGEVSTVYPKQGIFERAGIAAEVVLAKDKQYFVIGDNIRESKDSRYEEIGFVDASDIIGKVAGH